MTDNDMELTIEHKNGASSPQNGGADFNVREEVLMTDLPPTSDSEPIMPPAPESEPIMPSAPESTIEAVVQDSADQVDETQADVASYPLPTPAISEMTPPSPPSTSTT